MTEHQVPVIKLWDVLLIPVHFNLADDDADVMTDRVLDEVARTGPKGVIIDVSGVGTIDSHLCSTLSNLAAAARLMGTRALLCGMSAEVAMTLETMGVALADVSTVRSLEEALAQFSICPNPAGGTTT